MTAHSSRCPESHDTILQVFLRVYPLKRLYYAPSAKLYSIDLKQQEENLSN